MSNYPSVFNSLSSLIVGIQSLPIDDYAIEYPLTMVLPWLLLQSRLLGLVNSPPTLTSSIPIFFYAITIFAMFTACNLPPSQIAPTCILSASASPSRSPTALKIRCASTVTAAPDGWSRMELSTFRDRITTGTSQKLDDSGHPQDQMNTLSSGKRRKEIFHFSETTNVLSKWRQMGCFPLRGLSTRGEIPLGALQNQFWCLSWIFLHSRVSGPLECSFKDCIYVYVNVL